MSVESATYISQLNSALPANTDLITEGDNHITLLKSTLLATFPNFTATPVTPTTADLNTIAGASSTGATALNVATQAATNNSTLAASTAMVQAALLASTGVTAVLPAQSGNSGKFLTTNGSSASWEGLPSLNRIINGDMSIDNRNEGSAQTFTAAAALAYCVDRWYGYCTGANVTGQRVAGSVKSQYRYQFTGAASVTAIGFGQRIEAANSYDMNTETATFGVDLANSLLTSVTWTAYYANTADTFGTLASPTRTQIATGTFTVTSTVTRYTASITIPAAAITGIEIVLTVGAQTSRTWTIGSVSLERGAASGDFVPRPKTVEQSLCERFLPVTEAAYLAAQAYGTTSGYVSAQFRVPAYRAPTGITPSAAAAGYSLTNTAFAATVCTSLTFGAGAVGGGSFAAVVGSGVLTAGNATTFIADAGNKIIWTGCEL